MVTTWTVTGPTRASAPCESARRGTAPEASAGSSSAPSRRRGWPGSTRDARAPRPGARGGLTPPWGTMDRVTAVETAPGSRPGTTLDALADLVDGGEVLVLSGAGLSTDSGIPDYRGPSGALRRHTPMTYQTFVRDPRARHRYWARSFVGWRQIAAARPNAGHRRRRGSAGRRAAGRGHHAERRRPAPGRPAPRDVVELHGGLDRTVCLGCGDVADRARARRAAARGQSRSSGRGRTRSTRTATPTSPTTCSTGS